MTRAILLPCSFGAFVLAACAGGDPQSAHDLCPSGFTPVFHARDVSASGDSDGGRSSSIARGPGGPPMSMTCEPARAAGTIARTTGQVQAPGMCGDSAAALDFGGAYFCASLPPSCDEGMYASYPHPDPNVDSGSPIGNGTLWHCVHGCDVLVTDGGIYGSRTVCADMPPDCGGGNGGGQCSFEGCGTGSGSGSGSGTDGGEGTGSGSGSGTGTVPFFQGGTETWDCGGGGGNGGGDGGGDGGNGDCPNDNYDPVPFTSGYGNGQTVCVPC